MRVRIAGIGFAAPGLPSWPATLAVLDGRERYCPSALAHREPDLLPAAERRRAGAPIRLALAVAQEAVMHARCDPSSIANVFASSDGDGDNVHRICESLAANAMEISPTRFHNSVLNAASGYWGIATRCRAASNTVSGLDDVFAHGLLEAAVQVVSESVPVLLVAFDMPMPEPLHSIRPLAMGCGAALLLTAPGEASDASVDVAALELFLATSNSPRETPLEDAALEAIRIGNPAGRALAVLAAIAHPSESDVTLRYDATRTLQLRVRPSGASVGTRT